MNKIEIPLQSKSNQKVQEGENFFREFVSAFPILTPGEVETIVENTTIKFFKKGTHLLTEGQISSTCYLVIKGCVREYHLVDGEEKSNAFYTEFQSVTSFSTGKSGAPAKHNWVCAEDSILTVGQQGLEEEMIRRIPRLESVIRAEIERNTGKKQEEYALFMTSKPEQRYQFLLQHRKDLLNRVPQHQIASYIGVKPETLSRIRKKMVSKT